MSSIKIGFDFHGVLDSDPAFFASLIRQLKATGNEIHILTGQEHSDKLVAELSDLCIVYDQLFSITTYHKKKGTYVTYKNEDLTQPLIAPPTWDRTKADYASMVGLDFHIDDSVEYGQYFTGRRTQYLIYTPQLRILLKSLFR